MFTPKSDRLLGQIMAGSGFLFSDYGGLFLNGTFGWAALACMNIPEGKAARGGAMGAPGAPVAVSPVDWFTFPSAVMRRNVFAQDVKRHGFRRRLELTYQTAIAPRFILQPDVQYIITPAARPTLRTRSLSAAAQRWFFT
jgi:hypothetical protein